MKLLIVDDQAIVRSGITHMLNRMGMRFDRVLSASTVADAIELLDRQTPDILLLDIMMQGESGFEVARHIKARHLPTKIVIITSHARFDYAREAIDVKADAYLLKPLDESELYQTLFQLRRQISRQPASMEERMFYYRLLESFVSGQGISISFPELSRQVGLDAMRGKEIALCVAEQVPPDQASVLRDRFVCAGADAVYYPSAAHRAVFILAGQYDALTALARDVLAGYPTGMSGCARSLEHLSELYRQAMEAFSLHATGSRALIVYDEPRLIAQITARYGQRLADLLYTEDTTFDKLHEQINALFEELHPHVAQLSDIQARLLSLLERLPSMQAPKRQAAAEALRACTTLLAVKAVVVETVQERYQCEVLHRSHSERLIDRALAYMDAHLDEALSLAQLAEYLQVNYNYLSGLFRKTVGVGFSTKLNQLRMQRSAALLRDTPSSVQQIAKQVGYSNEKYFYRIFQSTFGMTPVTYRFRLQAGPGTRAEDKA